MVGVATIDLKMAQERFDTGIRRFAEIRWRRL
jgi:hypothetical protein